jgi:hypothetical protein
MEQVVRDGGRHEALGDLGGAERQVERQRAEAQARRQRVLHDGPSVKMSHGIPGVIMRTMTSPLIHSGWECSATGTCICTTNAAHRHGKPQDATKDVAPAGSKFSNLSGARRVFMSE